MPATLRRQHFLENFMYFSPTLVLRPHKHPQVVNVCTFFIFFEQNGTDVTDLGIDPRSGILLVYLRSKCIHPDRSIPNSGCGMGKLSFFPVVFDVCRQTWTNGQNSTTREGFPLNNHGRSMTFAVSAVQF